MKTQDVIDPDFKQQPVMLIKDEKKLQLMANPVNKETAEYLRSLADKIEKLDDRDPSAVLMASDLNIPIIEDAIVTASFDVDSTLVIWNYPDSMKDEAMEFKGLNGHTQMGVPHKGHINEMKTHQMRGHRVNLWSGGGWEFAYNIAVQLGLIYDGLVDTISSKPHFYWDDADANSWMGKPAYIPLTENHKEIKHPYTPLKMHTLAAAKDEE